jgi:pyruvate dehydrogenase E2 component (dihydrolipoamide acetyltransferase)
MPDVVMPRLSDSMEEGTILKWLKSAGDEVAKGDELVEIETDKATMTYEADSDGSLEIVAEEGSTLSIGEVIARIGEGASAESSAEGGSSEEGEQQAAAGEGASGDGASAPATTVERTEADAEGEQGEAEGDDEAQAEGEEQEDDERPDDAAPDDEARDGGAPPQEQPESKAPTDGGGQEETASAPAPTADGNGGRPKASPVARRIAREHGVDLSALEGTGPGGRIVKADVEAAASGGAAEPQTDRAEPAEPEAQAGTAEAQAEPEAGEAEAPAPAETGTAKGDLTTQEPSRIQQLIARRMAESKATIPHFTLSMDVDMEGAVALRDQLKELAEAHGSAVPSYNDMVVKASAIALRDFPLANASYRDGHYELHSRVNIGVAVAGSDTLIVPTIFDADHKGLGQIAQESQALAEKVRDGKVSPPELSGGTFSITNLGMYGVTSFTAVINPPQSAILAVGKLEPKPVVRDGDVVVRNTMNLTIACDHRILSGAPAAEFLGRIRAILEQPIALAL